MRVAISTMGASPESLIHPQFGRCEWFIIFEEGKETVKAFRNPYIEVQTGAGIGCAQDLIQEGVKVIISGQVGPKAYEVLNRAGIEIYLAPPTISAQDSYKKFLSGKLPKMEIKKF